MSTPADTRQQWYLRMARGYAADAARHCRDPKPDATPEWVFLFARLAAHFGRLALGQMVQFDEDQLEEVRALRAAFSEISNSYLTLKAERDALKERLEQAREALQEFVEWHGGAHEEDCPGDDTCDCAGRASNAKANAVLREVEP